MGYFSNFDETTLDDLIDKVNGMPYKTGKYTLLDYSINTTEGQIKGSALNEVTIINPTRTLMLDVFMDNVMLEHFRGTGICVSTPAGSTAYNKTCPEGTTLNKEERLKYFAKLVCEIEHYEPSSRICPHDLYYEDFEKYFEVYRK